MNTNEINDLSKAPIIPIGTHTMYHTQLYKLNPNKQSKEKLENPISGGIKIFYIHFARNEYDEITLKIVKGVGFNKVS